MYQSTTVYSVANLILIVWSTFQFQEIREIIARYDTLTATHQDLFEREAKNQEKYEQEKARLMKFTEVKADFNFHIECHTSSFFWNYFHWSSEIMFLKHK